jgi:hypothetical protein
MTLASVHDTNYFAYLTLVSCHTQEPIKKVYADKGYRAPWNMEGRFGTRKKDG